MATNAEKLRIAKDAKNDRYARFWAVIAMVVFLSGSIAANVATAWDGDVIAKIVAGAPPVSLFITSMMFERMRASKPALFGMALSVVVSLAFSWYHITLLVADHGQPLVIAVSFPVTVDVPMLFAGWILLKQAKPVNAIATPQTSRTYAHAAHATKSAASAQSPKTTKTTRTRTTPAIPVTA